MSRKLNIATYMGLVDENIEWVESREGQGIISQHVIECIKDTVLHHYGKTYEQMKEELDID